MFNERPNTSQNWGESLFVSIQEGYGDFQVTQYRGIRADMYTRCLKPIMKRSNLQVQWIVTVTNDGNDRWLMAVVIFASLFCWAPSSLVVTKQIAPSVVESATSGDFRWIVDSVKGKNLLVWQASGLVFRVFQWLEHCVVVTTASNLTSTWTSRVQIIYFLAWLAVI